MLIVSLLFQDHKSSACVGFGTAASTWIGVPTMDCTSIDGPRMGKDMGNIW